MNCGLCTLQDPLLSSFIPSPQNTVSSQSLAKKSTDDSPFFPANPLNLCDRQKLVVYRAADNSSRRSQKSLKGILLTSVGSTNEISSIKLLTTQRCEKRVITCKWVRFPVLTSTFFLFGSSLGFGSVLSFESNFKLVDIQNFFVRLEQIWNNVTVGETLKNNSR